MHIDASTPVKEIALSRPQLIDLLERWHIDYACAGDDPLERACASAGVAAAEVIPHLRREVGQSEPPPIDQDVRIAPLHEVVDHVIGVCHAETKRALRDARAVVTARTRSQPELAPLLEAVERLAQHAVVQMQREEDVLYARVRALACARNGCGPWPEPATGYLSPHVSYLREGHARANDLLRAITAQAAVVLAPPPEHDALRRALRELETALHRQIHLENNVLIPRALLLEPAPEGPDVH